MVGTAVMLAEVVGSGPALEGAAAAPPASAFGPASDWSLLMLLGGGALLALWILGSLRAKAARAGASAARPAASRPGGADMDHLAARLAATLDQRAERLERLIAAADERLAALAEAADSNARSPAPSVATRVDATAAGAEAASAPRRRAANRPRPGRAAAPADPTTSRIYSLADAGSSAASIARDVGEPIGKVELILALRGA